MKYEGPRSVDDFVRFVERIGDEKLHVLKFNEADIKVLQARDDVNVFVFCTPDGEPTEQVRWIASRGLTYLRAYFGTHPSDSALCGGQNTAFLINDVGTQEIFPEKGSVDECMGDELDSVRLRSVMEWVIKHKHLAVDRIDQSTFHHLAKDKSPRLLMFISREGEWEDVRPYLKVLREVSQLPIAEDFTFGWLDGVNFLEWVEDLVPAADLPAVIVYCVEDESAYTADSVRIAVQHAVSNREDTDGVMKAAVERFIQDINSGELRPTFNGPAGYVLGPVQRIAPSLLPYLHELRRGAQSDVLFIGLVVAICALSVWKHFYLIL